MLWPSQCCTVCPGKGRIQVATLETFDGPQLPKRTRSTEEQAVIGGPGIGIGDGTQNLSIVKDMSGGAGAAGQHGWSGAAIGIADPKLPACDDCKRHEKDELMPFRRRSKSPRGDDGSGSWKRANSSRLHRRPSIECLENYLSTSSKAPATKGVGAVVTEENVVNSLSVVRGPGWQWREEDGGAGNVGTVLSFDKRGGTATVLWHATGLVHAHYRVGAAHADKGKMDLAVSLNGEAAGSSPSSPVSSKSRMVNRRNSQAMFSMPMQTVIIFDWDDTLFPTTYVRDDLELDWQKQLKDQPLNLKEKADVSEKLGRVALNVQELMRLACSMGKVILVTLARSPWVHLSCENFFPRIGTLIKDLNVPVIYAQEGEQVDYKKMEMMENEEIEQYWSGVKGKAIASQVKKFYSQYEGQSWKNIISIGDSDFERLGTQAACKDYLERTGLAGDQETEVDGHVYKVRTKTFKMVDQPTVEELAVEVAMLHKWLPLMVNLDSGFDVNVNDISNAAELRNVEKTLKSNGNSR